MANVLSHAIKKRSANAAAGFQRIVDEYLVTCEPGVTQVDVLSYFRGLKIAPGYLGYSTMKCSTLDAESSTLDGQLWKVTARWEPISYSVTSGDYATPLDEPWTVRESKTSISQVMSKAYAAWVDGQTPGAASPTPDVQIVNSAGDPFDPPLMQDILLPVVEMTKNMTIAAYKDLLALHLDDTVNNGPVTVASRSVPKWGAKINIEGSTATYVNPSNGSIVSYMQARIVVTIHPQTWSRFLLNVGFRAFDLETSELVRVAEKGYSKKRSDVPVKLDINGCILEDEAVDAGYWLGFLTYKEASWASVDFPTNLSDLD